MAEVQADIVVVGDGPAGSALAQALTQLGVDVVLVGPDAPWQATYGTWADDIEACSLFGDADVWAHRMDGINVRFGQLTHIARPYGVINNEALRRALRERVTHRRSTVTLEEVDARIVIDATGWPSRLQSTAQDLEATVGWQTAFGVVLTERPRGDLGNEMLMDFSDPRDSLGDDVEAASFAYALPVEDGWLVEETVLVANPAVAPERLESKLASRLGLDLATLRDAAVRTETVEIPMGTPPRPAVDNVVRYGAAAGMINPATGYSVAASIINAGAVADRLAGLLEVEGVIEPAHLDAAVWPRSQRRTRLLHDYGLSVMKNLDLATLRDFFATFFDMPTRHWAAYFRLETKPLALAAVMLTMFRRAPWALRRRLVSSNPLPFVRLLRP